MTKEELEKKAQELLAQAEKCLEEAAECAEQGGFSIDFTGGGTYVPSAAFGPQPELKARALEQAKEDNKEIWDNLSDDEKEDYIEDYYNDLKYELIPYDYCDAAGWWMPSRNC